MRLAIGLRGPHVRGPAGRSRALAALVCASLTAGILAVGALGARAPGGALGAGAASADTPPPTAAADALPTAQVDGVVWTQAVAGNTVYAGGKFANARPAGAAPGVSTTPRGNLLAYDITTGTLDPAFRPTLNQQVRALAVSPDGSRLYVGGEFTTAEGVTHNRLAAYDTSTGALLTSFVPNLGFIVKTLVATNSVVYAGGSFTTANGVARTRLAAFGGITGALLSWKPTADQQVLTMVMAPGASKIIVGGQFQYVNGVAVYGSAALDPVSGALLPWAANQTVKNYTRPDAVAGTSAGIYSLTTDGTRIYGTGYNYRATGNLEGTFAADPATGSLAWVEDCHGDTYASYPAAEAVYVVGHPHFCGNVGGFPQTDPWSFHRALAFSTQATGTITSNITGNYANWVGKPAPSPLHFYPDIDAGVYTGQNQGAWTITGNGDYLVLGGEFPKVNGVAQQGLVRFASRTLAPNKQGAVLKGSLFVPKAKSYSAGTIRLSWPANYDRDDSTLTYKLVRDSNTAAPVYEVTATSNFWKRPLLGFPDTGLVPGSAHTYRLSVTDPHNNLVYGDTISATAATDATALPYAEAVRNDGADAYWRLGDATGPKAVDSAGASDLRLGNLVGTTLTNTVTGGAAGAIVGDPDTASTFNGTATSLGATTAPVRAPGPFTAEAWIKTTTTSGGKIIGFGDKKTGLSGHYDRHVYMDDAGHLSFGAHPGTSFRTVTSTGTFNDGRWHHVVASLGTTGMSLYVDSVRVGYDAATTYGEADDGYWRVGGDNLAKWPGLPTSSYFAGVIDDVALYPAVLTTAQVRAHYVTGTPYAVDTFARTVTGGLGSATVGGAWTVSGAATDFSVAAGTGRVSTPRGTLRAGYLGRVASRNTEVRVALSLNRAQTGDGSYVTIDGRRAGTSSYRLRLHFLTNRTVTAQLVRVVGGVSANLPPLLQVPGVTYVAGSVLKVRLRAYTPPSTPSTTQLRAYVWTGTTEPKAWQLVASDTASVLQVPGNVGVFTSLPPSSASLSQVLTLDNLRVGPAV